MIMHSFILLSALSAAVLARPQNGPIFPDPIVCDCDVRTKPNLIVNPSFGKDSSSSITIIRGESPPTSWFAPHTYNYIEGHAVKIRNDTIAWQTKSFIQSTTLPGGLPRNTQIFLAGSSWSGDVLDRGSVSPDFLAQNVDTKGQVNGALGGCACLSFELGVYVEGLTAAQAAGKRVSDFVDEAYIKYSVYNVDVGGTPFQGRYDLWVGGDHPYYSIGQNAPIWPTRPQIPGSNGGSVNGIPAQGHQFSLPKGLWELEFQSLIQKKPGVKPVWLLLDNVKLAWGTLKSQPRKKL